MVDRLTKSAHFIPVKSKRTVPSLASVYIREIVRLHREHDVFHVSHLRKCLHETAEAVEPSLLKEVKVERDVIIRRAPTRILGSEIRKLKNREVRLVKVKRGEGESNATWETEAKMRSLYPFLFEGMSFKHLLYHLSSAYLIFSMSSH